ncbi:ABC transporter permease [Methanogenium marinum]|uniref:ABC transporter permease n=1 Tax=Methanogenium marinum TaxID=348610 RepID=A0A9Q4KT97_9EURY|nr:ABC transporter permease [Methanogenium marinum]MDE4907567.1 ABC transporter permease [Methanogenium marinum]
MASTYLLYVTIFGVIGVAFLWLRDARIFYRTGDQTYRKAAYMGVLFTAFASMGIYFAYQQAEFLGMGIVLIALYLQGRVERKKLFGPGTTATDRLLGTVPIKISREINPKKGDKNT